MNKDFFEISDERRFATLSGCQVIDQAGETVGSMDRFWKEPFTDRIAFIGLKTNWLSGKVHVIPVELIRVRGQGELVEVTQSAAMIRMAPAFSPKAELSDVEKQEISAYFGQVRSLDRVTSIEEMRPEEAPSHPDYQEGINVVNSEDRGDLERHEQAFFDQKGFVTDPLPEVDASEKLRRAQEEAKARDREDRLKSGLSD